MDKCKFDKKSICQPHFCFLSSEAAIHQSSKSAQELLTGDVIKQVRAREFLKYAEKSRICAMEILG